MSTEGMEVSCEWISTEGTESTEARCEWMIVPREVLWLNEHRIVTGSISLIRNRNEEYYGAGISMKRE